MTSPEEVQYRDMPIELREKIAVAPIPRNMHPVHHAGRREARARAIGRVNDNRASTVYTDVADYARRGSMTAVVTTATSHITSITLPCTTTDQAEEAAIALAISQTTADTVVTDSQQACRNYLHGRISKCALNILLQRPLHRRVKILWTPAHSILQGNNTAHNTARELSRRAPRGIEAASPLLTYHEISQHYRLERRIYPPAHESLTKAQERILRLLQTNTFPHLTKLRLMYPTQYSALCQFCGEPGTLYHMVWGCQKNPKLDRIPRPSYEQWESVLSSSSPEDQLRLVERAVAAGTTNGVLK